MPRPASGQPHWKAIAVKLPPGMVEELKTFTGRYYHRQRLTISDVVRKGIPWAMEQLAKEDSATEPMQAQQPASLSPDDIRALVDEAVRQALASRQDMVVPSHTVISDTPVIPQYDAQPEQPIPAPAPSYDTSKYILGKLCPRGHDYHGTGQSLLRRANQGCLACDAARARERRKAKAQA
jgi:Arc/MetJ-type ribon-helix-helix transcriptional regulator